MSIAHVTKWRSPPKCPSGWGKPGFAETDDASGHAEAQGRRPTL
ncbi:hypothetical protein [Polaromonas sp. UBA4122]|nr:hypothetical protein [Polaromonas sp. UBA4122]